MAERNRPVLVDTSVWVDHLRHRDATLVELLEGGQVVVHPFVIGEIACGNLSRRATVLDALAALPAAPVTEHAEVLGLLEASGWMGRGLGWVDVCLLASAVEGDLAFWTRDRRLARAARELRIALQA